MKTLGFQRVKYFQIFFPIASGKSTFRPLSPRDSRARLDSVNFHRRVLNDLDKMDEEDYPSGKRMMASQSKVLI